MKKLKEMYEKEDGDWTAKVTAIYKKAKPEKLEDPEFIARTMKKYEGKEKALVTELVEAKAPDPKRFLLERLQRMVNPDASVADTCDTWNLASWVQGTGVHRVIAEAMQRSGEDDLAFVRALKSRDELAARLQTVTERVVDKLWREAQTLQEAGVATEAEQFRSLDHHLTITYWLVPKTSRS